VTYSEPARTTTGRIGIRWIRVAALVVVIAATAAVLGTRHPASSPAPSSSATASRTHVLRREHRGAPGEADGPRVLRSDHRGAPGEVDGAVLRSEHGGALGEADGAVPDGTTVFDGDIPGVAKLDPALLSVLRQAASDAADSGVEFLVDSGWRSPEYQAQLLRDAVSKYGSEAEAARWVAPPNKSAHVKGDAVDLGRAAASWLTEHGARYGLCQIYGNEPWHYELRPEAIDHGCPAVYADPTHDPRMLR
jgi:zinc D-Ala-D-Ala carboxypeptidase